MAGSDVEAKVREIVCEQLGVTAEEVSPSAAFIEDLGADSLDTVELELEASSATADLARYQREAEKARAAKNLADMRIAQALADMASRLGADAIPVGSSARR